jgi:hypothetical protein
LQERPFKSSIEERIRYFHEHHETNRWNLKDRTDSYLLYIQLDVLQFRYFELALALSRAGKHKKSHYAWAKHDAYNAVIHDLFPYRDGSGKRLREEYRKVQNDLKDGLEQIEIGQDWLKQKTLQTSMAGGGTALGEDEP